MTSQLTIGLYAQDVLLPHVVTRLLEQFDIRNDGARATFFRKYGFRSEEVQLNDILTDPISYITQIVPSRDAVWIESQYRTEKSEFVIDVRCYGSGHDDKLRMREDGQLSVTTSLKDVIRSIKSEDSNHLSGAYQPNNMPDLLSIDALFLDACGLRETTNQKPDIEHAAIYIETGWPAADGCSTVYHHDVHHFAQDCAHSYAEYQWGILPPRFFQTGIQDVLNIDTQTQLELRTIKPIRDYSSEELAKIYGLYITVERDEFLRQLTPEAVKKVFSLSPDALRSLLRDACERIDGLRCYDFGTNGFVLATNPPAPLWKAYAYLIDAVNT